MKRGGKKKRGKRGKKGGEREKRKKKKKEKKREGGESYYVSCFVVVLIRIAIEWPIERSIS